MSQQWDSLLRNCTALDFVSAAVPSHSSCPVSLSLTQPVSSLSHPFRWTWTVSPHGFNLQFIDNANIISISGVPRGFKFESYRCGLVSVKKRDRLFLHSSHVLAWTLYSNHVLEVIGSLGNRTQGLLYTAGSAFDFWKPSLPGKG